MLGLVLPFGKEDKTVTAVSDVLEKQPHAPSKPRRSSAETEMTSPVMSGLGFDNRERSKTSHLIGLRLSVNRVGKTCI